MIKFNNAVYPGNKKILWLVFVAILLVMLLPACEMVAPIKIQNNTDQNLAIIINGVEIGDVAPGEKLRNRREMIEARFNIEAINSQGQTIYEQEITYEDMKKMDWTVVITSPE